MAAGVAFNGASANITNTYLSLGVQFQTRNANTGNIVGTARSATSAEITPVSGTRVLTANGLSRTISLNFFSTLSRDEDRNIVPATPNNLLRSTTDFVRIAFLDVEVAGNTLRAFNLAGQVIGEVTAPCVLANGCDGVGTNAQTDPIFLQLSVAGIHRVDLIQGIANNGDRGDVTFDNLSFNPVASRVPVPAALPLLATALGMMGWLGRRRRVAA